MKNILLLTDFSENSENAISFTLEFLEKETSLFYVMHVHKMGTFTTNDLMLSSSGKTIHDSIIEIPKQKIQTLIKRLQKKFNNSKHSFESIVDFDDFTDAIKQAIQSKKIDLIVIGSNGKTGAKEIIFGSNTLNIIRKVNCTTLVIPEGFTYKSNKEMLLPLDSIDSLHGKVIQELSGFIKNYKLNLNVLRINTHKDYHDFEFYDQSNLATLNYKYFAVNDVPIQHAINSFIQIKNIAITAIFIHKETFFERFFSGSSSTKISNSLKAPLLIFHID